MAAYSDYPVKLVGVYEERVNRLLWLIKWMLVIPHLVVIWLLSIPILVTLPVSWLAVIILGRYPSFLWSYHAGLLRWSWRVNFYSFQAGSTDQYPPFSFESRDDYPANLLIEYPETSSRLTGFFRWLLIIPHWMITGILSEIVSILVFFALVIVLFTGRYPESMFDIIMGMNRWVYRASAYGWLLVDDYPPFSFD